MDFSAAELSEFRETLRATARAEGMPEAPIQELTDETLTAVLRLKAMKENSHAAMAPIAQTPLELRKQAEAACARLFATARIQDVDLQIANLEPITIAKWAALGRLPDDALIHLVHALDMGNPAVSKILN